MCVCLCLSHGALCVCWTCLPWVLLLQEGELRPQLLDRFGMSVNVRTLTDVGSRTQLVLDRCAGHNTTQQAGSSTACRGPANRTAQHMVCWLACLLQGRQIGRDVACPQRQNYRACVRGLARRGRDMSAGPLQLLAVALTFCIVVCVCVSQHACARGSTTHTQA